MGHRAGGLQPGIRKLGKNFRKTLTGATWFSFRNTSTATPVAGRGSSHQTGWTEVVTKLMQQGGEIPENKKAALAR